MIETALLVRAGRLRVGLPVSQLQAVTDPAAVVPVPSTEPSLAGVTTVRGAMLPVISLHALLGEPPEHNSGMFVVVEIDGSSLCLAVDEAETLLRGEPLPLPPDAEMPWARAVLRDGDAFVPLLDLEALAGRLSETGRLT